MRKLAATNSEDNEEEICLKTEVPSGHEEVTILHNKDTNASPKLMEHSQLNLLQTLHQKQILQKQLHAILQSQNHSLNLKEQIEQLAKRYFCWSFSVFEIIKLGMH